MPNEEEAFTQISGPLLPFENLSTQPRIIVQPSVVPSDTTRIYNTKQNLPSSMCLCARVCCSAAGEEDKTGNSFFYNWPDLGGQIVRDSPDAESPLASVSNPDYFCFCYK